MRHARLAAAAVLLLTAGATLALFEGEVGNRAPQEKPAERVTEQIALEPGSRGCRQRVEGPRLTPIAARDTTIGPVAFLAARSAYRSAAMARSDFTVRGIRGRPMKVVAVVAAGEEVTVSVPRGQRGWMRLLYDESGRPTTQVTLRACRRFASPAAQRRECGYEPNLACRWRNTQFSGGFAIEMDKAPRRGACSVIAVRVAGRRGVLRRPLFARDNRGCARTVALRARGQLPESAVRHRDPEHDLSVSYPPDWHRARATMLPDLAKPADVLAVGNFGLRARRGQTCTRAPDSPQLRVGRGQALVLVTEDGNPQPPSGRGQPDRYRLLKQVRPPGRGGPDNRPGQVLPWRCLNRVGISGLWEVFVEDGRAFYAMILIGEGASPGLRRQALGVLESLEIGEE